MKHLALPCIALSLACHAPTAHAQAMSATGSAVTNFSIGTQPISSLVQAPDGFLYGDANAGGASGFGYIYAVAPNGTVSTSYAFSGLGDGGAPAAGLLIGPDGALYGTTTLGGASGFGTIFRYSAGAVSTLHSFDPDADGNSPDSTLTRDSDGNLYGTLAQGSYSQTSQQNAAGAVFRVSTSGSFIILYAFPADESLGSLPLGRLVQASDGTLWGTTSSGDTNGYGNVFVLDSIGTLTRVHTFTEAEGAPLYGLVQFGSMLYGVTFPTMSGNGEIFTVNPSTHAFTVVYTFTGQADGGAPASAVFPYSDGSLYGTTQAGGANGTGTFFRLQQSSQPLTLYNFPAGSLNTFSDAALLENSAGTLYLPILFDVATGLSSDQFDGAGSLMQIKPVESLPVAAPVNLTAAASIVVASQPANLAWSLADGASDSAQQCSASSIPEYGFSGLVPPSGSASLVLPIAGTYDFTLTCGGNVSSTVQVIAVNSAPSSAVLTGPPTVVAGTSGTLVATISSTAGGVPTGTVTFIAGGSINLATVPLTNGTASLVASTAGVAPGTYPLQAVYNGDSAHLSSNSATVDVRVVTPASSVALTAVPATVAAGQSATFTAMVSCNAATPSGTVDFYYYSLRIGSATLHAGSAQLQASSIGVPPGTYSIHAVYPASGSCPSATSSAVPVTVK